MAKIKEFIFNNLVIIILSGIIVFLIGLSIYLYKALTYSIILAIPVLKENAFISCVTFIIVEFLIKFKSFSFLYIPKKCP